MKTTKRPRAVKPRIDLDTTEGMAYVTAAMKRIRAELGIGSKGGPIDPDNPADVEMARTAAVNLACELLPEHEIVLMAVRFVKEPDGTLGPDAKVQMGCTTTMENDDTILLIDNIRRDLVENPIPPFIPTRH